MKAKFEKGLKICLYTEIVSHQLDGRLTVGENIADNGGVKVAYGVSY